MVQRLLVRVRYDVRLVEMQSVVGLAVVALRRHVLAWTLAARNTG